MGEMGTQEGGSEGQVLVELCPRAMLGREKN